MRSPVTSVLSFWMGDRQREVTSAVSVTWCYQESDRVLVGETERERDKARDRVRDRARDKSRDREAELEPERQS